MERAKLGGTCLHTGCIPTKTLRSSADVLEMSGRLAEFGITGECALKADMPAIVNRKRKVTATLQTGLEKTCAQLKVRVVYGKAELVSAKLVRVTTAAVSYTHLDVYKRQIQGDPVYLFIYIDITDITEQRVLQKKLEERSELLRNALEMAERANRAKSDFLSRMSHDIRTPMNAIMGMLSIAKKSWDDPDRVRDCLDKVENSARFLLALINDILDMAKIESGKAILKKKAFDFAAFTRNLAAMFYGQAETKQVRFQVLLGRKMCIRDRCMSCHAGYDGSPPRGP